MPTNKKISFIVIIILQILVLFGIILFKNSILSNGTEIFLRIEPVDPKDPLRGDYMTFKFTDLSEIRCFSGEDFKVGDTAYVHVMNRGEYWVNDCISARSLLHEETGESYDYCVTSLDKEKPRSGVFLKGVTERNLSKVEDYCLYDTQGKCAEKNAIKSEYIVVSYGIEDYFIPEGKGQNLDFSGDDDYARVIVDADGNAVLKEIYIDGKSL